MTSAAFADRLAALVEERRSQICLGLDPDPAKLEGNPEAGGEAADAVADYCERLVAKAGDACVAVKLQLACFERLGRNGSEALFRVAEAARDSGLLVIADGKRGDVPLTAAVYAQAMVGETPTPWGPIRGLDADAFTANPLLGRDALEPLIDAAAAAGSGIFVLVRTSNAGAADVQDLPTPDRPLHELLAEMVDGFAGRLAGAGELSGMGAVVGATEPRHLTRLRELMPRSVFLIPGVGAQGGRPQELGAAFTAGRASALITASRSIAEDEDPAAAAQRLRDTVWEVSAA